MLQLAWLDNLGRRAQEQHVVDTMSGEARHTYRVFILLEL
jgi:hypothetical protein